MSVFLRWGVFGILSVAGLLYAYNASKDLAKRRSASPIVVAPAPEIAAAAGSADTAQPIHAIALTASCEVEAFVAQRAIEARDAGDPLDRLLRIREIAFEADETRRERLAQVAKRWFAHAEAIGPFSVRRAAAAECAEFAAVKPP